MKKSIHTLLIIVALLALSLYLFIDLNNKYYDRMYSSKIGLMFIEQDIHQFYEEVGRFPNSLGELEEYVRNFPNKFTFPARPGEVISQRNVSRSEHTILDGTGGMFYDPNTGKVKINLTRQLRSYWIFYFGSGRNEVPSDW
jgi:hypothetical protein